MSGTVCGIIDAYNNDANVWDRRQVFFTTLYRFFERMVAVGNATRVALQWGTSGTGMDFYDESNPSGENAFAVYKILASASSNRTVDLYVLFQWCSTNSIDTTPGNPAELNGNVTNKGVGIMSAFREDGGSPWNGTTNNDGTDTKGSPVWTAGGSTLHVLSRANSDAIPNGDNITLRENLIRVADLASYNYTRIHCIGDADSIIILHTNPSNPASIDYYLDYIGYYEPHPGLTITNPYIHVGRHNALPLSNASEYGSTPGNELDGGGVLHNVPTSKVQKFRTISLTDILDVNIQPNTQPTPAELDQVPIFIRTAEDYVGICGQLPAALIALVTNVAQETTNSAGTRAYIGSDDDSDDQIAVPWDSGAAPGSGTDRLGRTW